MSMYDDYQRDSSRTLDRLVDGELSPHDRRELLTLLEDEPAAWRRCALAFLEAQSWQADLPRVAEVPMSRPAPAVAVASASSPPERWITRFALAACLVLAFAMGRQFSDNGWLLNTFLPTGTVLSTAGPQSPGPRPEQQTVSPSSQPPVNWQVVTLVPREGDAGEPIQLVVDSESAGDNPDSPQTNGDLNVGKTLARPFEREGWNVQRVERYVPIELSDGRRLVVPIEELDIRSPEVVQF